MSVLVKFYFGFRKRKTPIKAKRYITKKQKHALAFKTVCVFLIFLILFTVTDISIRPVVRENSAYIVKNEVTIMINDCVASFLEGHKVNYSELVNITYDASGGVSAVSTNTVNINKLKTGITNDIAKQLKESEGEKIKVSLGNIFDSYLLDYIGLEFQVKLTDYGFVGTNVISEFKSGGINQTLHRLKLSIKVDININVGTLYQTETVETEVLLTETVLVGNVPDIVS